jgi:ACT domain-containing protein
LFLLIYCLRKLIFLIVCITFFVRPEKKAKAFKKAHELSKTTGVSRAVKAVGVSRYGYYKWLERNSLTPVSRFKRAHANQEEEKKEGTDNMCV